MRTDRPKYHLVSDEQMATIKTALNVLEPTSASAKAMLALLDQGKPLVAVEIHHTDDWAGLYVDGKLVVHGDSYLTDERLQSMVGATDSYDGDWLKPDGRTAMETIEEVHARKVQREANEVEAAEKVAEARRLIEEAERLTGQKAEV